MNPLRSGRRKLHIENCWSAGFECPPDQTIWADLMVRFVFWDAAWGHNLPAPEADTQWAVSANATGRLRVWCHDRTAGANG